MIKTWRFFERINKEDFNVALSKLLKSEKRLYEITDLNECKGKTGIYVMVLDKYKQMYIGQAKNIKARIMQHWNAKHKFDRLIWSGGEDHSVLSIDSFGALDTTRIFVLDYDFYWNSLNELEYRIVKSVPDDFKLNRVGGGGIEYGGLASNHRQLDSFEDRLGKLNGLILESNKVAFIVDYNVSKEQGLIDCIQLAAKRIRLADKDVSVIIRGQYKFPENKGNLKDADLIIICGMPITSKAYDLLSAVCAYNKSVKKVYIRSKVDRYVLFEFNEKVEDVLSKVMQ